MNDVRTSISTRHLLLRYLRPQGRRVALLGALLLATTGLQLLNPQIVRVFIDTATTGGSGQTLTLAALLFVGVAVAGQVLSVWITYLGENVAWAATNRLREDLAEHCLGLDMPFHNTRTAGEFIERIDGDINALSQVFSQFTLRLVGSGLLLVGVLIVVFREDTLVGLALLGFAVVILLFLNRSRAIAVPYNTAERQSAAALFGFIEERLAGLEDLRPNGAGAYVMRRFHERLRDYFGKAWRASRWGTYLWSTTALLFGVGYVGALALGGSLYLAGAITIGTVFLFYQYTQMLRQPLEQIAQQMREFQRAAAGLGRVQELLAIQPVFVDGEGIPLPAGPLAVEFDHVWFTYDASADRGSAFAVEDEVDYTLRDITLRLEEGRVLGLLGRTGSGKTTMTRLLFRLYDITRGGLRVGDVDVRDARLAELRQRIGLVTQEVQLFQASVRDNLTFFDPAIPDERILAVLDNLGLGEWYVGLAEGLDTELSAGGGGLSAGQAQLLAFARVFLRDPGLVILDEASSRLDPATETLIERAVDKLLQGRTAIIIAHRLGTVQRADEIVILDGGQVVEHGPRAYLAADPASRFATLLRTGLEEVLA